MMLLNSVGFFAETFLNPVPGWRGVLFMISLVINLYLTFIKGTEGPNQYGEDPIANE